MISPPQRTQRLCNHQGIQKCLFRRLDRNNLCLTIRVLLGIWSNSDVNLSLKKIAAICGINRRIVFHAARHTYATEITLSHGVPLETVSKMLGHTRVDTTQIYAKVTDEKIDADTKRLDSKISERFTIAI